MPRRSFTKYDKAVIERALRMYSGNRIHTAKALKICTSTLVRLIREYDLEQKYPANPYAGRANLLF